jgi:exopolysaccharide biosynthesis WecB/TagA/CpsF family protein
MFKVFKGFDSVDALPKGVYSFLNPFTYYVLNKRNSLDLVDGYFIDGSILCRILKYKKYDVARVSFDFTSIAYDVFAYVKENGLTVAIIGSEKNINLEFCNFLIEKGILDNSNIVIKRNGFFDSEVERKLFATEVVGMNPDVVVVGMGAGYQENFLNDLKVEGFQGRAFSCGGFMHQTVSKGGEYYPDWIDRLNLRFLYRMYDEPKLVPRYCLIYPMAILKFFSDKSWRVI